MPYSLQELEQALGLPPFPSPEKLIECSREELESAMGDLAESYSNGVGEDRNRELPASLRKRLRTLATEGEDPSKVDYGVILAMFEFGLEAADVRATFAASPRGLHASERPTHRGNFANYLDRSISKAEQQYKANGNEPLESVEIVNKSNGHSNEGIEGLNFPVSYSWAELKKSKPAKVRCRIQGLLPDGGISALIGQQKASGKTTLLLHASKSLVTGSSFLGHEVEQGAVYYLSEMDAGLMRQYGEKIFADTDQVHFGFYSDLFRLSWRDVLEYAAEQCECHRCKLLIVDTLPRWARIKEENNAGEMAEALNELSRFSLLGISTITSLHERKSGGTLLERARGSGVVTAIPDQIIGLSRSTGKSRKLETIGRLGEFDQFITLTDNGYEVEDQQNQEWFDDAKNIHRVLAESKSALSGNAIEKRVEMGRQRLLKLLNWGLEKNRWRMKEGPRNSKLYSVIGED